jgi:DNA-binding NarL/FixJ family response regulator
VIRVAIIAGSRHLADEMTAALASEEQLEVVDVRISPRFSTLSAQTAFDVVLAIALAEFVTPPDGPPVVMLTDASRRALPGPNAPHAVLPIAAPTEEIVAALLAAANGLYVLTADQAIVSLRAPAPHEPLGFSQEKLTARELEVLRMLADGLANKEIAQVLRISGHTIKFHVSQILAKLQVASRTEAVTAGIRSGLLSV